MALVTAWQGEAPLTIEEEVKAWSPVTSALPDLRVCGKRTIRNPLGPGLLLVCGTTTADPLGAAPMVFVVLDNQAYAASVNTLVLAKLPHLARREDIRNRTRLGRFTELDFGGRPAGSPRPRIATYANDPRPIVCGLGIELTREKSKGFVPAQRAPATPSQRILDQIKSKLSPSQQRGRLVMVGNSSPDCSLTLDAPEAERSNERDEFKVAVVLTVHEDGKDAYRETLTSIGEDLDEATEAMAHDVQAFVRNNYARLSRKGQPSP
jgi:hypothetical protein